MTSARLSPMGELLREFCRKARSKPLEELPPPPVAITETFVGLEADNVRYRSAGAHTETISMRWGDDPIAIDPEGD